MSKHSLTLAAAAVAALSLTACGQGAGSSDPTPPPSTQQAETTPEQSVEPATTPEVSPAPVEEPSPSTEVVTPEVSEPAATASTGTGDVTLGGSFTATIDGQPFTIDDAKVICMGGGGDTQIAIANEKATGQDLRAIAVTLEGGNVTTLMMGSTADSAITYVPGSGGNVTAEIDATSYTFKGEAPYVNVKEPTKLETKPFELMVTCS